MTKSSSLVFLLSSCLFLCVLAASPETTRIKSGQVWVDTNNEVIHAHGGQIWKDEATSKFYWVGESAKYSSALLSTGINLYSSFDLGTWKFEGMIFTNVSIKNVKSNGPFRIERPKIIFNKNTQEYVLWFHLDDSGFSLSSVGVATSKVVNGSYVFVGGFKPDGSDSYDMTLYQDEQSTTGDAYLCRSVFNQYAGLSQLTPDYLNTTTDGIISKGPRIEGMALFYAPFFKKYYLLGSHLTGWSPNPAVLSISDGNTLKGAQWNDLGNPTGSPTTYGAQSTFVFKYTQESTGNWLFIMMADNWNYPNVLEANYVWLPIVVDFKNESNIQIPYSSDWSIGDFLQSNP